MLVGLCGAFRRVFGGFAASGVEVARPYAPNDSPEMISGEPDGTSGPPDVAFEGPEIAFEGPQVVFVRLEIASVATDIASAAPQILSIASLDSSPSLARWLVRSLAWPLLMHGSFYIPGFSGRPKQLATEAACGQCGYELHGLRDAARCPECGHVLIGTTRAAFAGGSMIEAPMAYLRTFVLGCWLLVAGGILTFILAPLVRYAGEQVELAASFAVVGLTTWVWGVWVITRPRQLGKPSTHNTQREWSTVRLLARWAHVGVALGAALFALGQVMHTTAVQAWMNAPGAINVPIGQLNAAMPTRTPVMWGLQVVGAILMLGGLVGPAMLGVYMARLADWANDDDLATRLRAAVFAMIGGPILMVIFLWLVPLTKFPPLIFLGLPLGWLGLVAFVVGVGMFIWNTLVFVDMGRWAISNAKAFHAAQMAVMEKKAALYRSLSVPEPANDALDVMPPLSTTDTPPAPPRSLGRHVIAPYDASQPPVPLAEDPKRVRRHPPGT